MSLEMKRNEMREGELEKEIIVDSAIHFINNAREIWTAATLEDKQWFQKMMFPAGIPSFFNEGFGTTKMSLCYETLNDLTDQYKENKNVVQDSVNQKSIMVIPQGVEPWLPD